ncbi:MAG: T9SS type A sorting domain-containing protein [Tannerellaceae bacterium]|nr:T9SS type A sorting domain-containing protein [Tannerellaceae bacterium]
MNKNTILFSSLFTIGVVSTALCQDAKLEVYDPTCWETFVQESVNPLTIDTFVIQSFEGTEVPYWAFEDTGEDAPVIVDASQQQVLNQRGDKSLELRGNCQIRYEWEKPAGYDLQIFSFYIAARKVSAGATFTVGIDKGNTTEILSELKVTQTNYALDFGQNFTTGAIKDRIYISNADHMNITTKNLGPDGAFFIDYMTVSGSIKRYSLFRGEGKWGDVEKWTHRPAYRNRHALVQGEVNIKSDVTCNHLHLGNGSVSVHSGFGLKSNQTFLHAPGSAVYTSGEWEMKQAGVYKHLPEKEKWYFVSFPFDVYKNDIDPAFELKDETTDLSGNYLYVLTYDGENRSYSNSLGNWKVVPENYPETVPLFERGKGYLIALDKEAFSSNILFSSQAGKEIIWDNADYEKYVDILLKTDQMEDAHHGWVLCGNPFPSPLPSKNISINGQSDRDLYYFDGDKYRTVPLKGDFVLPPYCAFFLKEANSFTIRFKPPGSKPEGNYLPENIGVVKPGEPNPNPFLPDPSRPGSHIDFRIRGNQLYLNNLPDSGTVLIADITGSVVVSQAVSKGSSMIPLNLPKGVYILSVRSGNEQTQEKFILY